MLLASSSPLNTRVAVGGSVIESCRRFGGFKKAQDHDHDGKVKPNNVAHTALHNGRVGF